MIDNFKRVNILSLLLPLECRITEEFTNVFLHGISYVSAEEICFSGKRSYGAKQWRIDQFAWREIRYDCQVDRIKRN